ncbi:MAG: hypothetical protein RL076_2060 [Chloroflexota bacterium]|jgi:uncharacterized membrane protein
MQTPLAQTLIAMVAVAVFLLMAQRAQAQKQQNRAYAMRAAAAGAGILAANAALRMFGVDVTMFQGWVALLAFACIAVAGVFLVRAALRNEAMQIRHEVQRQADEFKATSDDDATRR